MMVATESRPPIRLRGRSLMALVLAPESPLPGWLTALDAQMQSAPQFFEGKAVIVDLAGLPATTENVVGFLEQLEQRGIRIIGTEGSHPSWEGIARWGRPLSNTRATTRPIEVREPPPAAEGAAPPPVPAEMRPKEPAALVVDRPVRSGQQIVFEGGDVTVLGSVSSGAEIAAGGSIHVYGTLRGRAIAGLGGNPRARIFCRKLEAEFLAIDGLYRTADDFGPALLGRAIQAWLDGDSLRIATLD